MPIDLFDAKPTEIKERSVVGFPMSIDDMVLPEIAKPFASTFSDRGMRPGLKESRYSAGSRDLCPSPAPIEEGDMDKVPTGFEVVNTTPFTTRK